MAAPQKRDVAHQELADPAGALQRRRQPVPRHDECRRPGKSDPEQQHQDRHAADDLDIEARDLAQPLRPRQGHQRDAESKRRGQREADHGDEDGDADALGDGGEDLGVKVAGGDGQRRGERQNGRCGQPPGEFGFGGGRRGGHQDVPPASLRRSRSGTAPSALPGISPAGRKISSFVAGALLATSAICESEGDSQSPPLRERCPVGQRGVGRNETFAVFRPPPSPIIRSKGAYCPIL